VMNMEVKTLSSSKVGNYSPSGDGASVAYSVGLLLCQ
jgi:hypothetical protein